NVVAATAERNGTGPIHVNEWVGPSQVEAVAGAVGNREQAAGEVAQAEAVEVEDAGEVVRRGNRVAVEALEEQGEARSAANRWRPRRRLPGGRAAPVGAR